MQQTLRLRDTFVTPYDQMALHAGKPFTVVREVPVEETNNPELKGELFEIVFEDGAHIIAWKEEVYEEISTENFRQSDMGPLLIMCPCCGKYRDFLLKLPAVVVKATPEGEKSFRRLGYKPGGEPDNICFECLRQEAYNVLH